MAADAPALPASIGGYRVTASAGKAAGSTTYRAVDDTTGRAVTVKLLSARMGQTPEAVERFARDAEAAARLDHPNVVRVLDHGREGERLFLVTEAFDGVQLAELLRGRRLSVKEAVGVWKEVLKGLSHAHQKGVIHRDLNPCTVLATPDLSRVKLTDFGIGRIDALSGTTGTLMTGEFSLGTLHYLAPEQAEGRPADARSDIYAAGAIFHEMLTGRSPGTKFALPSHLNAELPPDVDVVVLKCLARNPAERYANVTHLLADLEHLEEVLKLRLLTQLEGISASTTKLLGGRPQDGTEERGRPLGLWIGIALAVVVLAVVAFLVLR